MIGDSAATAFFDVNQDGEIVLKDTVNLDTDTSDVDFTVSLSQFYHIQVLHTVKPVDNGHSKIGKTKILMTDCS